MIKVQVNAVQLNNRVRRMVGLETRVTPMMEEIGVALLDWVEENFETQGAGNGGWPKLAPNTIAAKGHSRILYRTGDYKDSFKVRVLPGARVQVYSDSPVAAFHEFGTRGPYRIAAVNANFLVFKTTAGLVFRREVMHPGLPKRPALPGKQETNRIASKAANEFIRRELDAKN